MRFRRSGRVVLPAHGTTHSLEALTWDDLLDAFEADLAMVMKSEIALEAIVTEFGENTRLALERQTADVAAEAADLSAGELWSPVLVVGTLVFLAGGLVAVFGYWDQDLDNSELVHAAVHPVLTPVMMLAREQSCGETAHGHHRVSHLGGRHAAALVIASSVRVGHVHLTVLEDGDPAVGPLGLAGRHPSGMSVLDAHAAEVAIDEARLLAALLHVVDILVELTLLRIAVFGRRDLDADVVAARFHAVRMIIRRRSQRRLRGRRSDHEAQQSDYRSQHDVH